MVKGGYQVKILIVGVEVVLSVNTVNLQSTYTHKLNIGADLIVVVIVIRQANLPLTTPLRAPNGVAIATDIVLANGVRLVIAQSVELRRE